MIYQAVNCYVGTSAITDPNFSSVKLLVGFEGADASTTVPDESGAAHGNAGVAGNAQIDTAQFKFGASSGLFDGTVTSTIGDIFYWADHADWDLGSGDFTIEAWVRPNALSGFQTIIAQAESFVNRSWILDFASGNSLRFVYTTDGQTYNVVSRTWTPSTGTWYHVVVDRSGNTLRLYVDGAMLGTNQSFSVTIAAVSTALRIGGIRDPGTDANIWNGWLDEVRYTKGVARYASDSGYTVPTAAFPRS